jgi:hypothetical protein
VTRCGAVAQPEDDAHQPRLVRHADLGKAELLADAQHGRVLARHVAEDLAYTAPLGVVDDAPHQQNAEPHAGHVVAHDDRVLGALVVRSAAIRATPNTSDLPGMPGSASTRAISRS